MVASMLRTVFVQPGPKAVHAAWDELRDRLAESFPKIGPLMDDAKTEVLAFTTFPKAHWQKLWSTNPLERINKEIKRRSRVVGIFPNAAAVIRRRLSAMRARSCSLTTFWTTMGGIRAVRHRSPS